MRLIHFYFSTAWTGSCLAAVAPVARNPRTGSIANSLDIAVRASPAPPCTTSVVNPVPAGLHCNDRGVLAKPMRPLSSPMVTNSNGCRDACFAQDACVSYGFNPSNKKCLLYSTTLVDQGFKQSTTSAFLYTNRHCFQVTCPPCPATEPTKCGKTCANLQSDSSNCGSCGHICSGGGSCFQGQCTVPTCSANTLGSPCAVSLSGSACCGTTIGTCKDLQIDNENCGQCGNSCTNGTTCQGGRCLCPFGTLLSGSPACQGSCNIDYSNDNAHCGSCDITCNAVSTCGGSACQQQPFYIKAANTGTGVDGQYLKSIDNPDYVLGFGQTSVGGFSAQRFTLDGSRISNSGFALSVDYINDDYFGEPTSQTLVLSQPGRYPALNCMIVGQEAKIQCSFTPPSSTFYNLFDAYRSDPFNPGFSSMSIVTSDSLGGDPSVGLVGTLVPPS